MSPSEKLDRRIDSSSDLSQYVYDFEKQYTEYMKKGYSEKNASIQARRTLNEILQENNPGLRSSDAMYDKETGIAAIAVKDKNTGETYIAYAGTNNITSNERVLAWSDKEPTNNMNLKILSLTLICIP